MDTKKHLEVARHALGADGLLRDAGRIVTALDSEGLLCTEADRELVEADVAMMHAESEVARHLHEMFDCAPHFTAEVIRWRKAMRAVLAERAGKPVEPASAEADALRAEIASLKERLAEATRTRKVWHEAEQSDFSPRIWRVYRHTECRRRTDDESKTEVLSATGDAAESIARAHAAKLDAEQGGGV